MAGLPTMLVKTWSLKVTCNMTAEGHADELII
jgi:hypothetical protein